MIIAVLKKISLKSILMTLLFLIVIASLATNVYFLSGRGIAITHHHHQVQNNNQQQCQIMMGLVGIRGNVRWKALSIGQIEREIAHPILDEGDSIARYLSSIAPERSLFTKILKGTYSTNIIVPEFIEE